MSSPQETDFSEEAGRRNYKAPHSGKRQIPTIQKYREHRSVLDEQEKQAEEAQHSDEDDSKTKRAFESVKKIFKDEDKEKAQGEPYPTANRNTKDADREPGEHDSALPGAPSEEDVSNKQNGNDAENGSKSKSKDGKKELTATEKAAGSLDPRQKRKEMKHNKRDDGGREVTDPVTHLPLVIRDSTVKDMKRAPENEPAPNAMPHTSTGLSGASKSSEQLQDEDRELQEDYEGMQKMFPPPAFDDAKAELFRTFQLALLFGVGCTIALASLVIFLILVMGPGSHHKSDPGGFLWSGQPNAIFIPLASSILVALIAGIVLMFTIRGWLGKRVEDIWADEVWDAARAEEVRLNKTDGRLPESVAWMNGLVAAVWPLINPELFASVVDMLEDVMQASLPKVVRMVSIDDLGQGSEAIRILGVRWLPTGAAGQSVDENGNLKKASDKDANDRAAPGEGEEKDHEDEVQDDDDPDVKKTEQEKKQKEQEQQAMREGMEAEQGDFVNMELAFSYRARSSGKSIKSKAKNAHLYLRFYLPGGVFVPVWVELRGIIGTMRLRLQLTPDPPFFSLCTLTFLGQPRADISCIPLSKHLPNLMDVPLISGFVQSSIDAALAEYVAPKSLTLDLKDMLVGDDFKKDTVTRGVVMILIKEAKDFKEGDAGFGPIKGSSDAYVTCSWSKFGKTITSTRIIEKDQTPKWHEWAFLLVTPEEINADEKLRLQLWDSDKHSADDDLGRVEVDLKELMHGEKTMDRMCDREDRLMGEDPDEKMPGTLTWSVGYYSKARITDEQLAKQTEDKDIKTRDDLKKHVSETAQNKLREATAHDETKEINQQKVQDYKEDENALICASPPDSNYPSGILSIQIHNITGLEVESLQKRTRHSAEDADREDGAEQSDDLPSSYCTIILNHKNIFMTRTKPKNAKPFFNAGTERFIRDWRTTEVMISVRDSTEAENDALLGIIYLPLSKVFAKRSQVMETYRLVGGIGFGRARISMVFRSVELGLPKELLGWDYGTLEIKCPVRMKSGDQQVLQNYRIKFRSNMTRAKMTPHNGEWREKHGKESIFLPCRNRYAMPLILEYRKSSMGPDSTAAFAVFWIQEIQDEEEQTVTMKVWKAGSESLKRASTCFGYEGMEEGEQPLGEIELKMRFWRGLSGYHKRFAKKNGDMRKVMEVLDTANDEKERDQDDDGSYDDDDSDSDSSSDPVDGENDQSNSPKPKGLVGHTNDDSSSENEGLAKSTKNPIKMIEQKAKDIMNEHNDSDDGKRDVLGQAKDYKDHHRQLHRKHRGIMQWQGARTAEWAVDKTRGGKGRVEGLFEHKEKGAGIEREV